MKYRVYYPLMCCIVILGIAAHSFAADKYVRKGASGSGASWSDAYDDLNNVSWSGMNGGDTLWIAAGSYTGQLTTINSADISVKRATAAAHGAASGWSDSYEGQVTVDPSGNFLVINTGADGFTLDGVGNNPWKFRVVGISGMNGMLRNEGADNVTIRNIEFDGNSENPSGTNSYEDGLRWMGGSNAVIERCYIHDYRQVGDEHMDGVQGPSATNITFRYNIFRNNGMHLFLGDCEWGSQYVNGADIHHNLFYNDSGIGQGSYNTIVFKGTNKDGSYTTRIENNTFVLRTSEYPQPRLAVYDSANCNNTANRYFRNNILYYSEPGDASDSTHSYNAYYGVSAPSETGKVTADPLFTDAGGNGYTLQPGSPCVDAGTSLGYTEDLVGTGVPKNGVPDMGAYEYDSGGTKKILSAPSLSVTAVVP